MSLSAFFSGLQRAAVWCRRWRHRQGYGVHSPFAFTLISDVVYNTWDYYAYAPLAAQRNALAGRLCEKDDRLIFRLVNHHQSRAVALLGTDWERTAAYVQAACPRAHLSRWADTPEAGPEVPTLTALLDRHDTLLLSPSTVQHGPEQTLIGRPPKRPVLLILTDIHRDADARRLWQQLRADTAVAVTFDLYRLGLAYLHPQLQKQDYVVNFF